MTMEDTEALFYLMGTDGCEEVGVVPVCSCLAYCSFITRVLILTRQLPVGIKQVNFADFTM